MSDASYNANVYIKQGTTELVVDSSGLLTVEGNLSSTGTVTIASGGTIAIDGTLTSTGTLTVSAAGTLSVAGTLSLTTAGVFKHSVVSETTAANLSESGVSVLSSTGTKELYTIDTPAAGVTKYLYCDSASATGFVNVYTGATSITFGETTDNHYLKFNAAEEAVVIVGLSATKWGILSNVGSVAVTTSST